MVPKPTATRRRTVRDRSPVVGAYGSQLKAPTASLYPRRRRRPRAPHRLGRVRMVATRSIDRLYLAGSIVFASRAGAGRRRLRRDPATLQAVKSSLLNYSH
jgi:hypothetical protein